MCGLPPHSGTLLCCFRLRFTNIAIRYASISYTWLRGIPGIRVFFLGEAAVLTTRVVCFLHGHRPCSLVIQRLRIGSPREGYFRCGLSRKTHFRRNHLSSLRFTPLLCQKLDEFFNNRTYCTPIYW